MIPGGRGEEEGEEVNDKFPEDGEKERWGEGRNAPPRKKRALSLPPSSPPAILSSDSDSDSETDSNALPLVENQTIFTPEDESTMEHIESLPPLPPLFPLPLPFSSIGQSSQLQTPRRHRAGSLDPPALSPMSVLNITPLKPKKTRGRPALSPETLSLRATVRKLSSSQRSPDKRKASAASKALDRKAVALAAAKKKMAELKAEAEMKARMVAAEEAAKAAVAADTRRAQEVIRRIVMPAEEGGFTFENLDHFFKAMWRRGGDGDVSLLLTKYAKDEFISETMTAIYEREGRAIQDLLTRQSTTTVTDLLKEFSMEELTLEIQERAPNLWAALIVLAGPDETTRRETAGESRRDKGLCSSLAKANNFQLVIGLFLLGSGASKREIEILAHAGLSVSYTSLTSRNCERRAYRIYVKSAGHAWCRLSGDNLNIAFKVAEQRLQAKSHFDSGTTRIVIPGKDAAQGTLPLDLKPPRERALPVLDWSPEDVLPSPESAAQLSRSCFWQLKRVALVYIPGIPDNLKKALEDCPENYQIPLHKTEQYPLPALKEDESTLEGTFAVYTDTLKTMGIDDDGLERHGLMFDDGYLLTDSLKEKPLMAGWGGKKATEWKPAHELIHISLPAHIVDGFRVYCGAEDLSKWAQSATYTEFEEVAQTVFSKLFSSGAVNALRAQEKRDITLENTILFNRDALFYMEYTRAIKKGDVGRVLNVLAVWMVMMRAPKTMSRYADAIFKTLVRIKKFPPKLRELYLMNWLVNLTGKLLGFKPVDLLQEHQNFWAKIIYNAKGSNRSWEWLAVITVCIFTLRDAMRTVQAAFKIPAYGDKHKSPPIDDGVALIAKALEDEKIQTYVADRPANNHVSAVRDLIKEGAVYADGREAFRRFTRDTRRPRKEGPQAMPDDGDESDREEEEEEEIDSYDPTEEDLRVDDEEFLLEPTEILASAKEMVDSVLIDLM
ncbi:hypothetical protein R3P38DRAFT_2805309 [Favolaschia claudopus]|uniref:DUF6589 domain-containing protein n=1 Tax=Favolaschia claudopus TaxID=2862362 RepID=A0AAV9ZP44_9AGAR